MFGVYIHIPFCIRRCPFCDFTLVTDAPENLVESYVKALCLEIEQSKNKTTLTSAYLGGGTPSILPVHLLSDIFASLKKTFSFSSNIEITLETNPEDVSRERAEAWKKLGVNRISLGVQSMDDVELNRLGRNHNAKQVAQAFENLRDAGIENISVDLMFGLENQSQASWKNSLQKILDLKPKHVSTYNLTIEKNTKYEKELLDGTLVLPDDENQAEMLLDEKKILEEHGFDPYEISNAALPGFESKHNMLYWTGKPYLGFGVAAHSFQIDGNIFRRYWNTKNIPTYIKNVTAGKTTIEEHEELTDQVHLFERLMTGLRLKKGMDLKKLEKDGLVLPEMLQKHLQKLVQDGLILQKGSVIQIPTEKIPVTNEILLRLFSN